LFKRCFPKVGGKCRWISEIAIWWLLEDEESTPAIVLDAPCGSGVVAERILMHARGLKIIGVDLERGKLEKAKKRLNKFKKNLLGLIVCDIKYLPFKNRVFPHAISLRSLYYLKPADRERALYEFKRVLCKRGKLIVSTITALHVIFHRSFSRTTRIHEHRIYEVLDLLPSRWLVTYSRTGFSLRKAFAFFPYLESRYTPSKLVEVLDKIVRPVADKFPFYLFGSVIFYELTPYS